MHFLLHKSSRKPIFTLFLIIKCLDLCLLACVLTVLCLSRSIAAPLCMSPPSTLTQWSSMKLRTGCVWYSTCAQYQQNEYLFLKIFLYSTTSTQKLHRMLLSSRMNAKKWRQSLSISCNRIGELGLSSV